MRHIRLFWHNPFFWLAFAACVLGWSQTSMAQRPLPSVVEDLRQVLRQEPEDLKVRQESLEKRIRPLRAISDLRQALALQEWRDQDADLKIAQVDQAARAAVARRFETALRNVLEHGDAASQLAAVTLIGEIGVSVRGITVASPAQEILSPRTGFASSLGPDLAKLVREGSPRIRAAAARSLGKIYADPDLAVPALASLQDADQVAFRRAAADSLAGMMRVVLQLVKSSNPTGIVATPADVVRVGSKVVARVGRGLDDADPEVRRLSVEAIQLATSAFLLTEVLPSEYGIEDLPSIVEPGMRNQVVRQQTELVPLARVVSEQASGLARTLGDPVVEIRGLTARVLEDMGWARLRLLRGVPRTRLPRRRAAALDRPFQLAAAAVGGTLTAADNPASETSPGLLLEGLKKTLPALRNRLVDADVHVRLAVVDTLETLEREAKPLAADLVRALSDANLFVRWAAVRALGKIGPVSGTGAVAAFVKLLQDPDMDLRLATITALERYGSAASEAIPALRDTISRGDTEPRVAAIYALEAIGIGGPSVVPALIDALPNPDVRVRTAAATVLGSLGSETSAVADALTGALDDPEPEVRRAASESLLNLAQKAREK